VISGGHGFQEPQVFQDVEDNPEVAFTKVKQRRRRRSTTATTSASFDVRPVLYDFWHADPVTADAPEGEVLSLFERGRGWSYPLPRGWPNYPGVAGSREGGRREVPARAPRREDGVVVTPGRAPARQARPHVVSKDHTHHEGHGDFHAPGRVLQEVARGPPGVTLL